MSKDMKINLAILVSFLTIMSMVVAGGIAFGTVKEGIQAQDARITAMQYRADELAKQTYEINAKISEVATDLRWIRVALEGYAKKQEAEN